MATHPRPKLRLAAGALAAGLIAAPLLARPILARPAVARPAVAGAPTGKPALGEYLRAVVALESDDFPFAAEHLLRALAADPGNAGLRQQAFLAVALAGRPEAARLATGLPDDPAAAMLTGNDAALAGRWDEAARLYADLPHDGGLADALRPVLVAWSQAGGGHVDAALQTLAPLLTGSRLPGFYALHAGLIADFAGRTDIAATDYHLAQTASPGLNLSLVRVLAGFAARHGQIAEARSLVHALVGAAPSLALAEPGLDATLSQPPVTGPRNGLARAYRGAASILSTQLQSQAQAQSDADSDGPAHDSQAARAGGSTTLLMLRYSLDLDPSSSETRLMMADADDNLHIQQAGLDALAPVPPTDPLARLVELRRAELERGVGHDAQARDLLQALSDRVPEQPEPPRELGEILSDEHRYLEAVTALNRAVADIPQPTGADWSLFFDRAVAYDRSHQWNRAETDLQHALSLSPEEPYVLNYLGYSLAEQNRNLPQARRMLERALDQKPRDGAFLDSLGWIVLKQGDVDRATDILQQAAELTPEDPTVNYHLGVAYWQAGRKREAQDQWQRALILNPDPSDLPKIEARLHEAANATAGSASP